MRATRRGAIAALAGAGVLAGCGIFIPHWTYRYRLTVEVERGDRLETGSSVIQVRREKGITGIGAQVRGEAAAVDLGDAGVLFALLRGQRDGEAWPYSMPHRAFARELGTMDMVNEQARNNLSKLNGSQAVLSPDDYPILARFRDIQDPKSVELVDPDDLAASFGPGVRLRRIVVELTGDRVTTGLVDRLPWLDNLQAYRSDPSNPFTVELPSYIGSLRAR